MTAPAPTRLTLKQSGFFPSADIDSDSITLSDGDVVTVNIQAWQFAGSDCITGISGQSGLSALSFTLIDDEKHDAGSFDYPVRAYRCVVGGGQGGTGTIRVTVDTGTCADAQFEVVKWANADATTPIVRFASANAATNASYGPISIADRDGDGDNVRCAFFNTAASFSAATRGAGYTGTLTSTNGNGSGFFSEYGATDTDPSFTSTANNGNNGYAGIVYEVGEASGAGGQTITADTVTTGASVPSPQLNLHIAAGTVTTSESVPNPQLNQAVLAGTIATGESVPSPSVAHVITAGTVATGEAAFAPQLNLQVIADTVTTGEQLYTPSVATDATTIITNLIGSDEHVREPTLTVHVLPDTIATGESVPSPTVVPGGVTVLPGSLTTAEAVYAPNVAQVVSPGALASGESVYPITLANGGFILADTVQSGESVFSPQLNLRVLAGTTTTGESVPSPLVAFTLQVILGTVPPPNYYVHAPVVTRDAVPFGWGPTEYVRPFPMGRTRVTFGGPRLRTRSS